MNATSLVIASTLGWVGAVGTVVAYALVSSGRMGATSIRFQAVNATCATFLALSAMAHDSWPSAASNLVWMLIAVNALIGARQAIRHGMARRWQRARHAVLPDRPTAQSAVDLAA